MEWNQLEFGSRLNVLHDEPVRITTKVWSAVTRHRFHRFGDLSPKQERVQRTGEVSRILPHV
jgi:hypothetical protein